LKYQIFFSTQKLCIFCWLMLPKALHAMHFPSGRNLYRRSTFSSSSFAFHLAQRRTHDRLSVESNKIYHRLRVVANFGDGDYWAGEIHTHARTHAQKFAQIRCFPRVACPRNFAPACVCFSPAPQSPSTKLETTRSLNTPMDGYSVFIRDEQREG